MKYKFKNIKRTRIIVISFFLIFFIMIPYFTFFYISHNDQLLKKYFYFIKIIPKNILKTFTTCNLSNKFLIFDLSYIALGTFVCSIISSIFYINYKNNTINFNNKMLLIGTIFIILFLFSTCLLFSFAEYYYELFIEWCNSLRGGFTNCEFIKNNEKIISKEIQNRDLIINLLNNLATGPGTNNIYPLTWIGINFIWWITDLQIIFIVFIVLKLSFKLDLLLNNNNFLNKKEELIVLKDYFNQSKIKKIISLYLIPNEFNISLLIVFFSIIVFIPQFIYTIIVNSSFTEANKFFIYSYFYSKLTINIIVIPGILNVLDKINIDYFNMVINMPGSAILINIIPIISLALIISMLFIFTFMILKKPNLTKEGFIIFYISFLIITIISIIIFLISQYELAKAVDYWNNQSDFFKKTIMKSIFKTIKLDYFWLQGNELLASGILTISFIVVLSIIIISHILKIKK